MPTLLNINNYHYRRGGADVAYLAQTDLFEEHGWDVVSLSMHHPQNLESRWSSYFVDEIEYGHGYGLLRKAKNTVKSIYSWEAARKTESLIEKMRPDVAHAHNIYHHLSPTVLKTARKWRVPTYLTLHDLKLLCPARTMWSGNEVCEACKPHRLHNVVTKRCMKGSLPLSGLVFVESALHRALEIYDRNVTRFISPSRFVLNKFVEWGWPRERFVHIPNFIDADKFTPAYSPGRTFVYFGRLSREKGVETLLDAAAISGVPVRIIGSGPEEKALRARAESMGVNAEFMGFRTGKALWDVVRDARAIVVPSEWYENAPISVLEAYALGKAVIGADIGGIPEMIHPEETGVLFAAKDTESLAETLSTVASLPDSTLEQWGRRARDLVVSEYSKETHYQRLIELYSQDGTAVS